MRSSRHGSIRRRVRSALPLILVGVLLYFILLIFFLPPASLGNSDDARQWTPVTHHHNEKSPATKESGPSSSSHANALPTTNGTTSTSPLPTGEPLSSKIDANASFLHHLWPDERYRDAPPTVQDAIAAGLLEHHTMPYPEGVLDNVSFIDTNIECDYYFDDTHVLTRPGLAHAPTLFNIGFESFAGIRHTALTRSSAFIGLEERRALLEYQRNMSQAKEEGAPDKLREAVAFDHERVSHYFTYEYNHKKNVSNLSPEGATAPRFADPPASEALPRMVLGDPVYDPILDQLQGRFFTCERAIKLNFPNHFCDRFVELMHVPDRPPLVVHLHKMYVFPFAVRCLYFRPQALTNATRKFVILGTEVDETAGKGFFWDTNIRVDDYKIVDMKFVLNHPLLAHWYSTNGNIRHPKFTPLPIGTHFYHHSPSLLKLSLGNYMEDQERHTRYTQLFMEHLDLGKMFPHISHPLHYGSITCTWLEKALEVFSGRTLNAPVEVVPLSQLPQRITTIYIVLMPIERERRPDRPSLTNDVIIFREPTDPDKPGPASAQHIALLPFTVGLYHRLLQNPPGSPTRHLKLVTAFSTWSWRGGWMAWLQSIPHLAVFLPNNQALFYSFLINHSFVPSPPGEGYDCFRSYESLVFGAIPILQNPRSLERRLHVVGLEGELNAGPIVDSAVLLEPYRDLPVVFVDEREDITLENMEKWRKEIYARAQRGEYKLEKLFMQYWVDKIYGHSNDD